jgi:DNA-binding HxlR family transcriptional regulator
METYGQFCPVSKAAEIFAERWTPLIIRELLMGSHRFNELEHGLPGIPRSLLTKRLRDLEQAGVVERRPLGEAGHRSGYHLTPAGEELFDIVKGLGVWGQRWTGARISEAEVDPSLLMWDMHRRINVERLPERRVVARFDFQGLRSGSYWLVLERPDPSVCFRDPGFDVDVVVTADALAMHQVWMGRLGLREAIRRESVRIEGPSRLARALPGWLAMSIFADVEPVERAVSG